jgi:hypothetical protein
MLGLVDRRRGRFVFFLAMLSAAVALARRD